MVKTELKYLFVLSSLSLLGILGNFLHLPLFFGIDFIFGSIAVMIAVRLLGMSGAVVVALIGGAYTYLIWGHPYAMIIFTAEALVVSCLWQRKISSLALADIIFWIVIGMPLIWLFYNGVMGMSQTPAFLILLKQPVNGIANAIIATYLLLLIPKKYFLGSEKGVQGSIKLKELIFTTLLGISLAVSFIIISYENTLIKKQYEESLAEQLQQNFDYFFYDKKHSDISELLKSARLNKNAFDVVVMSDKRQIIGSTLSAEKDKVFNSIGSRVSINENLSLWMPERNKMPFMLWWKQAYYFIAKPLPKHNAYVYIMQDAEVIINKIQMNILSVFKLLFVLVMASGFVAYFTSRALTKTISELSIATKNLPQKLKNNLKIQWPKSNITELLQLSNQAEAMSDNILMSFDEVNMQAKTILESSIDSIITIDDEGKILSFNHASEDLFGYSREEILGRNFKILVPLKYNELHDEKLKQFNVGEYLPLSGKRVEITGLHKDGHSLPVELSVTKTVFNQKIRYTGIITDISERKINEQLKRDFISTVSHELRTPLTSISGSVKLIQAQQEEMKPEDVTKLLDITCRNIDRLSRLINELLDFEKLQSESAVYVQKNINAGQLISEVVEQNQSFADHANIKLVEKLESDVVFIADPQRILQVVVNLVSNAIKFSPESEIVEIGCIAEQDKVKIYVKDKGLGIPAEYKDRIFERFMQVDSSDNRKIQRGTGLGLAISKRMIEDMGGIIGFDSEEGVGSTFFIIFPRLV